MGNDVVRYLMEMVVARLQEQAVGNDVVRYLMEMVVVRVQETSCE